MKTTPVSNIQNKKKLYYKSAALNGAIATTCVLGLSTAMDCFLRPDAIKNTVQRLGGKNKYIKNFLATAAVFSAIGAAANTLTAFIMEKIVNKNNSK